LDLTIGAIPFFWPAETVRALYATLARTPATRVSVGEWVCSKRLPFWQHEIPAAVDCLQVAGKEVALASLALITLPRERRQTAELAEAGLPVEVNDLSVLRHLPQGAAFWVGPVVNVYNEGTLDWLARRGATRICLPPELPLPSVARLAAAGRSAGVAVEVWGHGRVPLAISGRCYHARLHDRAKDRCQFVCGDDPDGRDIDTLDGQPFLTVNGVQTLGRAITTAASHLEALQAAGVAALRLSPHAGDFAGVVHLWASALAGGRPLSLGDLARLMPGQSFCNGFLSAAPGARPAATL
jgi:collagenase-like PrtC family protease